MKWYYKLERDVELGMPTAWSGFVRAEDNSASAHKAIMEKLGVSRMPANTLVASQQDLLNGKAPRRVRAQSAAKPKPVTLKKFEDVGMTFDQAEALLKQFGLKK
tara:strand:+ start:267 stop:578 length:312 start_codon:yes stop_codon:yes gene_type:complete